MLRFIQQNTLAVSWRKLHSKRSAVKRLTPPYSRRDLIWLRSITSQSEKYRTRHTSLWSARRKHNIDHARSPSRYVAYAGLIRFFPATDRVECSFYRNTQRRSTTRHLDSQCERNPSDAISRAWIELIGFSDEKPRSSEISRRFII